MSQNMAVPRPVIFGTAGHIDHGKTTLVRALTGVDTDRLPEEKTRGISIDLGFADMTLPSGRHAGFIDVPGHERFIRNMVAGVHGMDAVLLVVAADEGVMPQTREHLDILGLLGVRWGFTVITKTDLVDEEWLMLVEETTREALAGTFLVDRPIALVDAVSGRGLPELQELLDRTADDIPGRSAVGPVRLPVDRVFTVRGFGTVVTGTLVQGSIHSDQALELMPGRLGVRVRGLQVHNHSVGTAQSGQRVAVNLSGVDKDKVRRGQVLATPNIVPAVTSLVGEVRLLESVPGPVEEKTRVHCHIGTADVLARIYFYDRDELGPGQAAFAELRCEEPVAAVRGDRFLLRSYSPMTTIGGGQVIEPGGHHRRREPGLMERLAQRASGDVATVVREIVGNSPVPLRVDEVLERVHWSSDQQGEMEEVLKQCARGGTEAGYYLSDALWQQTEQAVEQFVKQFQSLHPLLPGVPRERLKSETLPAWPTRTMAWFMDQLDYLATDREWVRTLDFRPGPVSQTERDLLMTLQTLWEDSGLRPPTLDQMREKVSSPEGLFFDAVHYLTEHQVIVRLEEGLYVAKTALDRALSLVRQALAQHPEGLSTAELRTALDTNRRFAVLVLEWLDTQRVTRRIGDKRLWMG